MICQSIDCSMLIWLFFILHLYCFLSCLDTNCNWGSSQFLLKKYYWSHCCFRPCNSVGLQQSTKAFWCLDFRSTCFKGIVTLQVPMYKSKNSLKLNLAASCSLGLETLSQLVIELTMPNSVSNLLKKTSKLAITPLIYWCQNGSVLKYKIFIEKIYRYLYL